MPNLKPAVVALLFSLLCFVFNIFSFSFFNVELRPFHDDSSFISSLSSTNVEASLIVDTRIRDEIVDICTGNSFLCLLFASNYVECIGNQKAIGVIEDDQQNVNTTRLGKAGYLRLPSFTKVARIFCGGQSMCLINDEGNVLCVGDNISGQVGIGISNEYVGMISGHIGNKLPFVNLGVQLVASNAALGFDHACFLVVAPLFNVGNKVKCIGNGESGQLGYQNTQSIGSQPSQMGDALKFIDFGENVEVESLHSSSTSSHNCVIVSKPMLFSHRIKCWGLNNMYQLGYSYTNNQGDEKNEMGNLLPIIDLGYESRSKQLILGGYHTCTLLISNQIKCWGHGFYGKLGLGSFDDVVVKDNKHFPTLIIDTGRKVALFSAGENHSCFVYEDLVTMKCIGRNHKGQIGQGDTVDRGGAKDSKIPLIHPVDLDSHGQRIVSIHSGGNFNCVLFDDYITVKCFGENGDGQLGVGSINNIGDNIQEMGKHLIAVQHQGIIKHIPHLIRGSQS